MNAQQIKSNIELIAQIREFANECPTMAKIFKYLLVAGLAVMEIGIIITIS